MDFERDGDAEEEYHIIEQDDAVEEKEFIGKDDAEEG